MKPNQTNQNPKPGMPEAMQKGQTLRTHQLSCQTTVLWISAEAKQ